MWQISHVSSNRQEEGGKCMYMFFPQLSLPCVEPSANLTGGSGKGCWGLWALIKCAQFLFVVWLFLLCL